MFHRPLRLAALTCTALPALAQAARPFITDDARLTNAGMCQLESWRRIDQTAHETWAMVGCNPTGNLELTFGGGYAKPDDRTGSSDQVLQLKTLLRPLQTNDWGWGLAAGTVRHADIDPGPNLWGNTYAYLPASFSFNDDRLVVHANLGWLRQQRTRNHNLTWGLGAEIALWGPVQAIAEAFGDHRQQPYAQAGLRWSVLPGLLQIDGTVGGQGPGVPLHRWFSIGLRFTP
jgi:hypothetical protein